MFTATAGVVTVDRSAGAWMTTLQPERNRMDSAAQPAVTSDLSFMFSPWFFGASQFPQQFGRTQLGRSAAKITEVRACGKQRAHVAKLQFRSGGLQIRSGEFHHEIHGGLPHFS